MAPLEASCHPLASDCIVTGADHAARVMRRATMSAMTSALLA
jgi:hypothetical protein